MGTRAKLSFKKNETYKTMFNRLDGGFDNEKSLGMLVFSLIKNLRPNNVEDIFNKIGVTTNVEKAITVDDGCEFIKQLISSKNKVYMYKDTNDDYLYGYTLDFNKNCLVFTYLNKRREIPFSYIQKLKNKEFYEMLLYYQLDIDLDINLGFYLDKPTVYLKEEVNKIKRKINILKENSNLNFDVLKQKK